MQVALSELGIACPAPRPMWCGSRIPELKGVVDVSSHYTAFPCRAPRLIGRGRSTSNLGDRYTVLRFLGAPAGRSLPARERKVARHDADSTRQGELRSGQSAVRRDPGPTPGHR